MTHPTDLTGLGSRVLLLDADGNLFPSEEPAFVASAEVTNAFLAAYGVDARYAPEQLRLATTGKNFRTTAVDLAVAHGVRVDPSLATRHPGARTATGGPGVLTPDALTGWVMEEKRAVQAHLGAVLRPDPDVLEPLRRLAERYLLAAVSSSATSRLGACFAATGLAPLLPPDLRFSAEDSLPVPTSKPDPAVYLHACREVGVVPSRALAVEDSLPGARSAVAAGVPTVGNLQFVQPAERAERARQLQAAGVTALVGSWGELETLLSPAGLVPAVGAAASAVR